MHSLLQTDLWADFKARHGWAPVHVAGVLFLERDLPFGQRFLYAPELAHPSLHLRCVSTDVKESVSAGQDLIGGELTRLIESARQLGRARGAFVVRLEFFEEWSDEKATGLRALGLRKALEEVQPEWRRWIDLRPSEAGLLAQMKPKGRYNVRLSEKSGVIVAPETDVEPFWRLLQETARRDRFSIRSRDYYADLIETLIKNNAGELLVARAPANHLGHSAGTTPPGTLAKWPKRPPAGEAGSGGLFASERGGVKEASPLLYPIPNTQYTGHGQPLAAAIVSHHAGLASYLHGASSSSHRHLMAPYLLHWTAMTRAKARGCVVYDLLAVAPPESLHPTPYTLHPRHKYAGLTRFKSQFGGRTVHLLGSWDLVLRPAAYAAFRLLETLRRS